MDYRQMKAGDAATRWQASRRAILRRILACAALAAGGLAAATARAQTTHRFNLPAATDLAADAAASRRDRTPIVLFFDRGDCAFCERALREYLVPMAKDDAWRDRAIFRQVEVEKTTTLRDFSGASTTHRALAQRYRVTLAPTVVVVDATGKVLGSPVVGFTTPDFYGAYLENAVAAGVKALRG